MRAYLYETKGSEPLGFVDVAEDTGILLYRGLWYRRGQPVAWPGTGVQFRQARVTCLEDDDLRPVRYGTLPDGFDGEPL